MKTLAIAALIGAGFLCAMGSLVQAANVPCEDALKELRAAESAGAIGNADKAKYDDLKAKGIQRCNADDDKRADDFFTQAMALIKK